jgi:hypothetical protein
MSTTLTNNSKKIINWPNLRIIFITYKIFMKLNLTGKFFGGVAVPFAYLNKNIVKNIKELVIKIAILIIKNINFVIISLFFINHCEFCL